MPGYFTDHIQHSATDLKVLDVLLHQTVLAGHDDGAADSVQVCVVEGVAATVHSVWRDQFDVPAKTLTVNNLILSHSHNYYYNHIQTRHTLYLCLSPILHFFSTIKYFHSPNPILNCQ